MGNRTQTDRHIGNARALAHLRRRSRHGASAAVALLISVLPTASQAAGLEPGPDGSLIWGAGSGIALLAYLLWGLPRLRTMAAAVASTLLALGLLAVAWLLLPGVAWALKAWPVLALIFGHLGLELGRRRPAPAGPPRPHPLTRAAAAPASSAVAPPERVSLGRYRVESEIGRGAMGAVYLGRDPKIGRPVAIKTMALSSEFEGEELDEARRRFFREAETAGRLHHPDIVTIYDAGEDQGLAFIAMQLLKGENLQSYIQPGRLLPVVTVLNTVARVADALAYAHSQGVIHRDIKPANVMLDLASDTVKVTDFGIARITDSSRTRTGMILGTPSFMSPEQLAGRRVDGRSDLYSLGVMLYQLLTGKLPHRSESMATLMHQIANDPAPDVRSLRPELPEALAKIVAITLEKRPEARYGGGQQLASDLRAVARHLLEPPPLVAAPTAGVPPDSSGFEATVKLERVDPRHNSSS